MNDILKAPFPYMGGKSSVAGLVWERFGNTPNYVEPFCGSCAVLLGRPHEPGIETVNDANAWLCNFFRALQHDPDAVARYAADPVNEIDLHARGDWLFYRPGVDQEFVERLRGDPEWYDVKSAGWWVWGQSSWIGDNWGRGSHNARKKDEQAVGMVHARPHLGDAGKGVDRQLPHLGTGVGVNRQLPHLGDAGKGVNRASLQGDPDNPDMTSRHAAIRAYLRRLAERLCRVRVCCGDWSRVLGPTPTFKLGPTAVFLDPPYAVADRDTVYGEHESFTVAHDARDWCLANGDNPLLRICLAGYDEHDELAARGWTKESWTAGGGYSNQNTDGSANRDRETLWFSPHCLPAPQMELF